jgi:holo-[acyl-carrier protein] synthase
VIAGIGTDIVSVERIRGAISRHEGRFQRKVLSDDEMAACGRAPDAAAYVAKRFAAKEAFFKAFGQASSSANTWHQLSVLNEPSGRPVLVPGPRLAALMARLGIVASHVSLSDEREHAVAFVVLERAT